MPREKISRNKKTKTNSAIETVKEEVVVEKETEEAIVISHPDFRDLPDPEKTFKRIDFLLRNPNLSHALRAAAACLILEFRGKEDTQLITLAKVFENRSEFSLKISGGLISALKKLNLIESKVIFRKGLEITLLF